MSRFPRLLQSRKTEVAGKARLVVKIDKTLLNLLFTVVGVQGLHPLFVNLTSDYLIKRRNFFLPT